MTSIKRLLLKTTTALAILATANSSSYATDYTLTDTSSAVTLATGDTATIADILARIITPHLIG